MPASGRVVNRVGAVAVETARIFDCQLTTIESTGAGNWQGVGCRIWSSLIDDLQSREALKRAYEF